MRRDEPEIFQNDIIKARLLLAFLVYRTRLTGEMSFFILSPPTSSQKITIPRR
jgi:hypothetical protein